MADLTMQRLAATAPFAGLDEDVLAAVADASRIISLRQGEHLVETGDEADALYVVLSGHFAVVTEPGVPDEQALARLGPGTVIGEIAVLTGGTRSATLRSLDDAEVAAIEGERFTELLQEQPELGRQLARTASDRLLATRLRRHLEELFPASDVTQLASSFERADIVTCEPGSVLFESGDAADAAYVVVSGRVRVLLRDRDGEITEPVAEVGPGGLIGEDALLGDHPRAATVVAARQTRLARLSRDSFEALMIAEPRAMLEVTRRLVARHQDARAVFSRAQTGRASIAFVPTGPAGDVAQLISALTEELGRTVTVRSVSASDGEAAAGDTGVLRADRTGVAELRLERWLDELEAETDLLLLATDRERTGWSDRCIDRADHVVLVADATADPTPTPTERAIVPLRHLPHQRVTLLLQHPADADRPRDTAAWLAERDVDDHVHLREGHGPDLGRLARFLSGRSVWLVLGGGGAKGFAHLGVVRALAEVGLPIDGVAGSSMGTALGALVAIGTPGDELVAHTGDLFHNLLDYTLPVSGLIAAERIARAIGRAVDGRHIEDTWLPFRCVTTNLTRSTTVVHRHGDLQRAMRASVSIPGVMPPVAFGEDLHVDGGVMNNLPVDVARRETPTGTVIVSDVAPVLGPKAKGDHGLYVHGGGVLARRFTPGLATPRVPGIMPTLVRSLLVAAARTRDQIAADGLADLLLEFQLRGVGLLAFEVVQPVVDRGYEESIQLIRAFAADRSGTWSRPQGVGDRGGDLVEVTGRVGTGRQVLPPSVR